MSLERCLGQLFLAWFNQRHGRDFALQPGESPTTEPAAEAVLWAGDGQYRMALAVDRLYESEDAAWNERRRRVYLQLLDAATVTVHPCRSTLSTG